MLKYDVTTSYGLVLAPSLTVLTAEHLDLFRQHRIDFMDIITTNPQEQLEQELVVTDSQASSEILVQKAYQFAKQLFEQMESEKKSLCTKLEINSFLLCSKLPNILIYLNSLKLLRPKMSIHIGTMLE